MFDPLAQEWSAVVRQSVQWAQPATWGAGAIRQLAPLLTAPHPRLRRIVNALVRALAEWGPAAAYSAGTVLRPLVYASDQAVRGESLRTLAAVVARDPKALGTPDWRWRSTAPALTHTDPALTAPVTDLLAACPRRRRAVPLREAALWAEVARPTRRAA